MFPYLVKLNEIKRIENKEQIPIVKNMYDDILHRNKNINYCIKKYNLKVLNDKQYIELLKNNKCCNIALTNERCKTINKIVRKTQGRGDDYEVGDILRCIKRLKIGNITINKSYVYKIIKVDGNNISILDEAINEEYNFKRDIIDKHFIYGYARTVYSVQGKSIKDKVIIHQTNHGHATKKWLYVALSRATDLNNIYIYKGNNELINEEAINTYFNKKVEGYIKQDLEKGRKINKTKYITADWLKANCLDKQCFHCKEILELKEITADRLDNNLPHHIDNCVPCCLTCNVRKLKLQY